MHDLTEVVVTSVNHVLDIMADGEEYRKTGSTNFNERSSRSHSIFKMIIESRALDEGAEDGAVRVSALNLVDLAGSESIAVTQGKDASRAEETKHINKSLMALGRVILKLSTGKGDHVPFRDSKITRILQVRLWGRTRPSLSTSPSLASLASRFSLLASLSVWLELCSPSTNTTPCSPQT